jgi:P4 family phage/plasmid primase-like protien
MSQPSDGFNHFLKSNTTAKGEEHTHTKIPDKKLNIYPGSYKIDSSDEKSFYSKYYKHVFVNKTLEYLTEKQLREDGPIMIDIDLRYSPDTTEKQHTADHVVDVIMLYVEKIKQLVTIPDGADIDVFVMEKNAVNQVKGKNITKDGIHIIIGTSMHKGLQVLLRDKIIGEIGNIWDDLPITNTWDEVFDEGVTKGQVNWQMYGSRKPGHQAYLIKHHYVLTHDEDDWTIKENNIDEFNTSKNLRKLSARYTKYPKFEMLESIETEFATACKSLGKKKTSGAATLDVGFKKGGPGSCSAGMKGALYSNIRDVGILDALIEEMFEDVGTCDYKLKETHQYTMTLPKSYYGEGSYTKWMRVGWALASTSSKLFLSWLKFSSQSETFDWASVPELYQKWKGFDFGNRVDGLTHRSIMYWSKIDSREKYNSIHKETVDYFIEETVTTAMKHKQPTEFDLACVLFHLFKDQYVCVSIRNNCWYEYIQHRWYEIDSGSTLRLLISKDLWQTYVKKIKGAYDKLDTLDSDSEDYKYYTSRCAKLSEIGLLLKKTTWKNNIMREARELFYDQHFIEKLDQNPYLLCFNNCVVDFQEETSRLGRPDDYISKCTNIDYVPLSSPSHGETVAELERFMYELFPDEELRKYMWEHSASCLIGTNENQTFNIYTGSGRNGKSKYVDLMSKGLGDYKGTVPITLITQKRNSIGSTSSEIVQLMGTRLAVMQEPSKGDKINEGIMKEITGGDPIQGRALFKDTVTFTPQFNLVVCTNTLFEIKSNDDGTWRRIRVCDFVSKFLEVPYGDEDKFPREHYPHQFKIDKNIDQKFERWAPTLMAMLVDKSYVLKGNVTDCKMVLASSDQYRDGQDYLAEFIRDKIQKRKGGKIKKTEVYEHFRNWYQINYGKGIPLARELHEFMSRRFGPYKLGGWHNVSIIYDEDDVDDDDNDM